MNQKNKILHIISGLGKGGAEKILYRLILNDQLFQHEVISLSNENFYKIKFDKINVSVKSLNLKRGKLGLVSIFKLIKFIKDSKPSIIHTWMYHSDLLGGLIGKLLGHKNIIWCVRNSSIDKNFTSFKTRLVISLCAFFSKYIPKKIINCSKVSNQLHQNMGYPKEKCVVVNNGVDTSIYKPLMLANENLKTILNIKDNKLILGMVARWDAQKDLNTFLNALKILKNETKHQWHAILVGNGLDQNNEQLVKDVDLRGLKNHISLLGFKNNLVSIYNSFDVCVLTSAYGEGFPNVIAEAMSCGIPCIGTDVGDTKNIINNTGWIFNSKNSEELKNQIKETFEEIKQDKHWLLRKKLARERIVSNFTFSSMLKNYQLEWKNIL